MKLNELKSAIINKDLEELQKLSNETPSYSSIKEAQEFLSYIKIATSILEEEKKKLQKQMQEIKKLKKYNQTIQKGGYFNITE